VVAAAVNGKVVGDICVDCLYLGSHAKVHGNIQCRSLRMDRLAVLIGQLSVSKNLDVGIDAYKNTTIDETTASIQKESNEKDKLGVPIKEKEMQKRGKTVLVILLPQVDFYHEKESEAKIICDFLNRYSSSIDAVYVTLDSHHVRQLICIYITLLM